MPTIRIGTRQSALALWQAQSVKLALQAAHDAEVTLHPIVTSGDKNPHTPLAELGGKGLFLKELEVALLQGEIDVAVHSMKDVPAELPEGLHLGAICARDEPRDALVAKNYPNLDALPNRARIGTCSLRRRSQLLASRGDLRMQNLRGNVETRLKKLDAGEYDAIVLAAAGLMRLGLQARISERLPLDLCLPAAGQGAIGVECRRDVAVNHLLRAIGDADAECCVRAERAVVRKLGADCHTPLAAFAELHAHESSRAQIRLRACLGAPDGARQLHAEQSGARDNPEALGLEVAEQLLQQGAAELLARQTQ